MALTHFVQRVRCFEKSEFICFQKDFVASSFDVAQMDESGVQSDLGVPPGRLLSSVWHNKRKPTSIHFWFRMKDRFLGKTSLCCFDSVRHLSLTKVNIKRYRSVSGSFVCVILCMYI